MDGDWLTLVLGVAGLVTTGGVALLTQLSGAKSNRQLADQQAKAQAAADALRWQREQRSALYIDLMRDTSRRVHAMEVELEPDRQRRAELTARLLQMMPGAAAEVELAARLSAYGSDRVIAASRRISEALAAARGAPRTAAGADPDRVPTVAGVMIEVVALRDLIRDELGSERLA